MAKHQVRTWDYYSYWDLWKAKNGSASAPSKTGLSYKDFQNAWRTARKSGVWDIFQELAAEAEAAGAEWHHWAEEPEEESEPEEEPQQEKRWGDPGFWEDFGRQYREAEDRDHGRPKRPQPRPTVNGHYVTLGVTPDATREEIRSAYRALALKHHPDHGGSGERMREINLAYAAIVG
jgi:hypothetical protein